MLGIHGKVDIYSPSYCENLRKICELIFHSTNNRSPNQKSFCNFFVDAPSFITPQAKEDHVYGYLNGYANLTCFVEAEPKARFEWLSSPTKVRKTGNVTESPNQSILQVM